MEYRYSVKIYTNQRTLEWETNDISPRNLTEVVDLDSFDGDFLTKGEILDKQNNKYYDLTEDGYWKFEERK